MNVMNPFDQVLRGPGPVAWCKRCSRKHPRRSCELVPVVHEDRLGNKITHFVHPKPKAKKRRARRT